MTTNLLECVPAFNIISRDEAITLGLTRYFTGSACKYGHIGERFASFGGCVVCSRIKRVKQYWIDPEGSRRIAKVRRIEKGEKDRKKRREWCSANAEKVKLRNCRWRSANSAKIKEQRRASVLANPEKYREKSRAASRKRREERPELERDRIRAWLKANPDRVRANRQRRRSRKRNAEGVFTADDIATIRRAQRHRCAICRVRFGKIEEHTDHIQPLSRGGTNWPSNIQILCSRCNLSKNARDPIEFCQSLGMLL